MGWFRRNEHDEEQLSAYLDGELDARHAENVERHLASCDACTALLEELRETRSLLSALPAQTPRRSFVLGAEFAQAPVRDVARSPKRLRLALAPAVALSVFVALLVVDLGGFTSSSSSSDEHAALTMSREVATDNAGTSGAAGSIASAPFAATPNLAADGTDASSGKSGEGETQPATAPVAPNTAAGGAGSAEVAATPEGSPPPVAMSAALPTPAPTGPEIAAAGQAPEESSPEPEAFEAPESESGGGISTLRLVEIVAGVAVLASGFYVYVWPRLSRGGS